MHMGLWRSSYSQQKKSKFCFHFVINNVFISKFVIKIFSKFAVIKLLLKLTKHVIKQVFQEHFFVIIFVILPLMTDKFITGYVM